MTDRDRSGHSHPVRTVGRRRLLRGILGLAIPLALAACGPAAAPLASATPTAPAPAAVGSPTVSPSAPASASLALTPALTEGPYFKAGSPQRTALRESGVAGTPLVLTGRVLSRSGAAVAGALLDFWQADGNGAYDNSGYRLRGHQFTDAQGNYRLETVMPGLYPGRTEHIHVKVQAPGTSIVTTQLFFPGATGNANDSIFRAENLVRLQQTGATWAAQFDFVVDA